jgi:DNA-binding LacI/PurR family transcriptional regulator
MEQCAASIVGLARPKRGGLSHGVTIDVSPHVWTGKPSYSMFRRDMMHQTPLKMDEDMRDQMTRHDQMPAAAPVTLDDVARAAGVSSATVSRVINNFPRVAADTRQRVHEAIARLHYTPNFAGRLLATKRAHTLGLIITDITNPFYPEVVRGVEAAALSLGFSVLLYDTAENKQREAQALQLLRERQVDGLVICSSRLSTGQLAHFAQGTTPIVFVNSQPIPSSVGSVETDHEAGMRSALEHLAHLGHREIGYIGGPPASQVQQRRRKAFLAMAEVLGVRTSEECREATVAGGEAGAHAMLGALAGGTRPTALIAYNDVMAAGALVAARARGLAVPEQLSLVGHDDIPMSALLTPALTTVRQPMQELGSRAVDMLAAHLRGSVSADPTVLSLHPELVVRASSGPVP